MQTSEKIFNASQFVLMNVVRKISEIHENLQDIDVYMARTNLSIINKDLSTLMKLINTLEATEYNDEFSDDIDDTNSSSSSSDDLLSDNLSSSSTAVGKKEE